MSLHVFNPSIFWGDVNRNHGCQPENGCFGPGAGICTETALPRPWRRRLHLETLKITLGRRNHIDTFHVWSNSRMGLCHYVTFLKIQENWSSERVNPMRSLLNKFKYSLQKKTIAHHGHHAHHVWVQLQLEPLTIRIPLHRAVKGLKVVIIFARFPHTAHT